MLKRALLRGKIRLKHASSGGKDVLKSIYCDDRLCGGIAGFACHWATRFHEISGGKRSTMPEESWLSLALDPVKEKYVTE